MRRIFNPFQTICRYVLRNYSSIQIVYVPILKAFIFIIIFYVFVISFHISINIMIFSTSNIFSTVNNMPTSVNRCNFTLVFLKSFLVFFWLLVLPVLVHQEIKKGWSHIFQDVCLKCSKIHQLTIMYWIEHKSHYINLFFLISNFYKLF